jgi:hypothetical protein
MRSRISQRTTRIQQRLSSCARTHENNGNYVVSFLQIHEFETCVHRKTYRKPTDQDQIQDLLWKLGMKLLRIHWVMAFRQEPWLKPYVKYQDVPAGKDRYRKGFLKLLVNAFFGKNMENARKRRKVDLVSDTVKLKKLLAKQKLEQFVIVNEEVILVDSIRNKVTLNKPIYIGFTVLDVSKLLMFDFHIMSLRNTIR